MLKPSYSLAERNLTRAELLAIASERLAAAVRADKAAEEANAAVAEVMDLLRQRTGGRGK